MQKQGLSILERTESCRVGYELEDVNLFVNVNEYISRNEEDVLFEAHKNYAEIQVLISGKSKDLGFAFDN